MRFLATFLTVGVLLAGCGPHNESELVSGDAKLRRTMTGMWTNGFAMLTRASDGTFSGIWTNYQKNLGLSWAYEGKWEVTNGVEVTIYTQSLSWNTTNRAAVGSVYLAKILRVDDREMVWEFNGQTNSLFRKK